jgi:hypothetical protein
MTRTKKQLENILLVKALKRFTKTKIEKIEIRKPTDNKGYKSEEYSIKLSGFKFKLYFCEDLNQNSEKGHLWVLDSQGYLFENFDLSNENYAPTLKKMYNIVREKISVEKEKQNKRKEKEFNRNLKSLDRRL